MQYLKLMILQKIKFYIFRRNRQTLWSAYSR